MTDFFRALTQAGPVRLIAAFAITGLVAAALLGLVFRSNVQDKALLYSGLDLGEAAEIASRLDAQGVKYDLRGDGSSIFVPRDRVAGIRLQLSEQGLPSRGSVGYEIFDKQDALGSTSFVQNVNRVRALQGELERTIQSIDGVTAARVLLVLPERRLFEQSKDEPSASIKVTLARQELTSDQVRAIRNLAASAVPGLSVNRVTIADQRGRLLAAGAEGEDGAGGAAAADERKGSYEERLRRTLTELVESVTGPDSARVQVSADLDFSRVTENRETFDPEGQVVRSTTVSEEQANNETREDRDAATAGANVPDGAAQNPDAPTESEVANRTSETTNYEISRTTRVEVQDGGRVKKLSVAVAVDYAQTPPPEAGGQPAFAPISAEDLQKITALVRSGMGFDESRGDALEVVNVRFARAALDGPEEAAGPAFTFDRSDLFRAIELGVFVVTALALILFVLRPLVKSVLSPAGPRLAALAGPSALALGGLPAGVAAYEPPPPSALPGAITPPPAGETLDEKIDVARIQGQVRASSVKRISEVVESHPEQSVAIIRQWLHEGV